MGVFNRSVFAAIHGVAGRNAFADFAGVFFAAYLPYLLVAGFLVLVFLQKGARRKCYVFAEGALAVILARGIVTPVIQFFYHEARPFSFYGFTPLIGESGWSFPSAHMTLFFALAMATWYANRKWGWWYLALSTLMGFARIFVGVHWPLDIIGGVAIGIASAILIRWLLKDARTKLVRTTYGDAPSLSSLYLEDAVSKSPNTEVQ